MYFELNNFNQVLEAFSLASANRRIFPIVPAAASWSVGSVDPTMLSNNWTTPRSCIVIQLSAKLVEFTIH